MATGALTLFPNPAVPDLGCLVRHKHDLQIEDGAANVHVEFMPSIDLNTPFHQTYFRVKCGEAGFFERCFVYMTVDASVPPFILETRPPDWVLGGDTRPHPSDWFRYPTQGGTRLYWFFGQFRNPASTVWQPDAIVGHSYDIYENGTLSTVQYDDTGGDRDLNDFILEVAIVKREEWGVLTQAEGQAEANETFERNIGPRLREQIRRLEGKRGE